MRTQTWLALIILGFLISPALGWVASGLYLFNFSTAIIFGLYGGYQQKGYK
jgi:hypothetical protein